MQLCINKKDIKKIVWRWSICLIFAVQFYEPSLAQKRSDTVSFIHVSDIHFCNLDGYHPSFAKKRQHYGNVTKPLADLFESMPGKLQPDFMAITGDMIDFYEAESSSGYMMATQIEQFANLVDECNIPVYMVLGNHDIASYWVNDDMSYSSNQLNAGKARAQWVENASCFKNGTYYSRIFQVDTTTYRLIFLDNGYYSPDRKDSKKAEGEAPNIVDEYQLLWLEDQLNQSDHDIEIIFTHIPLFTPDLNDLKASRNTYFLDRDDTMAIPYEPKVVSNDEMNLWNVLEKNASARVVFSGHLHSNANHIIQFTEDYSLHQIMTGSFGRDARNWRLIQLTGNKILVSFPGDEGIQYIIDLDK